MELVKQKKSRQARFNMRGVSRGDKPAGTYRSVRTVGRVAVIKSKNVASGMLLSGNR